MSHGIPLHNIRSLFLPSMTPKPGGAAKNVLWAGQCPHFSSTVIKTFVAEFFLRPDAFVVVVCPLQPSSSVIQVARVQNAQFPYRLDWPVP